eukprot:12693444-Alexandrium_andersonii.AAC.1
MSASLVGSEMCIRDRGIVATVVKPYGAHAAAALACPLNGHKAGHLSAVSYTHLTLPTICSV